MVKKYPFDSDGRYTYGFTSSGLFTLLGRDGEPLYAEAVPLFRKLVSHILWIILWVVLTLILTFPYVDRILMSLIFFHLFLFGCRLTTLLIKGGIRPVLFPPLWIRLTRQLNQEKDLELLKRHNLDTHPGLLVNLALIQLSNSQVSEGHQTLEHAQALCPDHPDIIQIVKATAQLA